ncbi:hypothetical protein SCHPADRAFT_948045 [Schizopora paradoxa]|uniref:Integrase zinc-binding domain-containing protein n=1 Tax=Schizopora paradoxa TaxID=27342 RepID=A0A0H2QWV0_9AGAM|nr:hypothetical protein SCHPADRAFT_948045 [Schizopora paradoxa]
MGFQENMDTVDLIALRIRQLEKRDADLEVAAERLIQARLRSKEQFERRFAKRISRSTFQLGDWVLIRNSAVEKELNRKTKPRYLGPFMVMYRTKGGSYVIREPDGAVSKRGVAAFRLIPYIARDGAPVMRTLGLDDSDGDSEEDSLEDGEENHHDSESLEDSD